MFHERVRVLSSHSKIFLCVIDSLTELDIVDLSGIVTVVADEFTVGGVSGENLEFLEHSGELIYSYFRAVGFVKILERRLKGQSSRLYFLSESFKDILQLMILIFHGEEFLLVGIAGENLVDVLTEISVVDLVIGVLVLINEV